MNPETTTHETPAAESKTPRPLPTEFKKNGFTYKILKREGLIAMVSQERKAGVTVTFEVYRIRISPEAVFQGKTIPLRESCPSSSAWGQDAKTFAGPNADVKAEAYFQELVTAQKAKGLALTVGEKNEAVLEDVPEDEK